MLRRAIFLLLCMVAAAGCVFAADRNTLGCAQTLYNIAPQPLPSALEEFAAINALQLIYDRPRGLIPFSKGVVGCLDRMSALRMLLRDTGMVVRFYNAEDLVLGADGANATQPEGKALPVNLPSLPLATMDIKAPGLPDEMARRLYAALLEAAIRDGLRSNPATRDATFLMGIQLWLYPSGGVDRFSVVSSSGDTRRDEAVAEVLGKISMRYGPPLTLTFPVTVWINSRSSS